MRFLKNAYVEFYFLELRIGICSFKISSKVKNHISNWRYSLSEYLCRKYEIFNLYETLNNIQFCRQFHTSILKYIHIRHKSYDEVLLGTVFVKWHMFQKCVIRNNLFPNCDRCYYHH